MAFTDKDTGAVNELRCLCADVVEGHKSGHPGSPIGMAPTAYVIFTKFLKFSSAHPQWPARDRFILDSGHASVLLYSMLYLCCYLTLDDLKQFRTFGSKTPGNPERADFKTGKLNPGVEVTTGPLGQGVANAVGMAIAAKALQQYDKDQLLANDTQKIYVLCGDGCMQEGLTSEACSLAGSKKLNNIILLYDSNGITIDGKTDLSFKEDVGMRFQAYNWNVITVNNGNTDLDEIHNAILQAQKSDKPTLIQVKTTIGYGAEKQGTQFVHGSPLKPEGIVFLKKFFQLPESESFRISDDTRQIFNNVVEKNEKLFADWEAKFSDCSYKQEIIDRFDFIKNLNAESLIQKLQQSLTQYNNDNKGKATRQASQATLQLMHDQFLSKYMIIGSADLAPSCLTTMKNLPPLQYVYYGIREHAMCAISNGISAYGGFIPCDATFLVFFNYCFGAIRYGCQSRLHTIHIFTHDSIYLGEDGCTHQPIETLAQIRAMIGIYDWRPCDCAEVLGCYCGALGKNTNQNIICLSRQNCPLIEGSDAVKTAKYGGYVVLENKDAKYTLIATGSEVKPSIAVAKKLGLRVVSMPSFKLFMEQSKEYQTSVIQVRDFNIVVEPYVSYGWGNIAAHVVGIDTYGASATGEALAKEYEMDEQGIEKRVKEIMK